MLMLSKRYESTEVDRRHWLHVLSGTLWFTSNITYNISSDIHKSSLFSAQLETKKGSIFVGYPTNSQR